MICLAARFSHSVPLSGKSFVVVSWAFTKMESREQSSSVSLFGSELVTSRS